MTDEPPSIVVAETPLLVGWKYPPHLSHPWEAQRRLPLQVPPDGGFHQWGFPQNGWFTEENPINMDDDWGDPYLGKPLCSAKHVKTHLDGTQQVIAGWWKVGSSTSGHNRWHNPSPYHLYGICVLDNVARRWIGTSNTIHRDEAVKIRHRQVKTLTILEWFRLRLP